MGLSNLPDGVRERDLPAFTDVDCPLCLGDDESCSLCDGTGVVDESTADDYWLDMRADDILDDREYWNGRD